MISTSGISGAGLKKCMPTTRSGVDVGGRDLGDGERRRVRREHRVRPADALELGEELLLRRELLDDRLDHEVAVGEVGEVGRQREPADRGVARGLLELSLLHLAREEVRDPVARALAELERDLAADRLDARLDAELRDAGAHRAEPDDADLLISFATTTEPTAAAAVRGARSARPPTRDRARAPRSGRRRARGSRSPGRSTTPPV